MTGSHGASADWGTHRDWHWRGHRCHWRQLGDPDHPPLVLLHGFGTGSGHWRRNAAALAAAGWSVYGLDLLGFGSSSQPSLRLDNRLWSRQVADFLREVVRSPAVLVGHSLGGLVALTTGVFFPERVLALIAAPLPDPTLLTVSANEPFSDQGGRRPPWRRKLKRRVVVLLCRLLPLEILVPLLVRSPLLGLAIQSAYRSPVLGDGELHRLIARPARRPGAIRALRAMSMAMALRPRAATAPLLLRRLGQPMLMIWGRQDLLVPLEVAGQCQRFQRDVALTVIDDAGHCPHDEQAVAFNAVVIQWLETLALGPTPQGQASARPREHVP